MSPNTALVANNLPIPSALGSLDAYIGAVHGIPVLSVEEEQELAHRFRDHDDVGDIRLEPSWKDRVGAYLQRDDMQALAAFLRQRQAAGARIYPPASRIFAALDATPFEDARVVILG